MSTTNGSPPPEQQSLPSPDAFPIVGIGASAGGLEALDQFLSHVPKDSGMAFVIVQHLDPTHKGVMPELLQRITQLVVGQVRDGVKIEPNHAYVIPPNTDLSILHRTLHLFEPASPRGLRLPIDFFFRTLAEDQQERSVGVILSGMGSDGTLGLRAIKERAGLTLVQEPTSAKFDAMPHSAIAAGLADIVAPADALYDRLVASLGRMPLIAPADRILDDLNQSGLEQIVILLRTHNGHDFSQYKSSTLYRRIERRMSLHRLNKLAHYVRYLQENPQEIGLLFKELLIGVTRFFRDPAAWQQVQEQVIPALLANRPPGGPLRAWVAGCSSGEEAYSLAILFKEALEKLSPSPAGSLQIFATDLDRDAIDEARQGLYLENIVGDVSPERLQRFFIKENGRYRISPVIRELVTFATQNVAMDPPFTKIDLLVCRNLLIYLTTELQAKLISMFHYSLNPSGFVFLGSAETISDSLDLFEPLSGSWRLYRRKTFGAVLRPMNFPPLFVPVSRVEAVAVDRPAAANLQTLADRVLLQQFSPAAVLTNAQGDILYISGRTGKYLEPAAGQVNWNLFAMARAGLDHELPGIFQAALHQASPEAIIRRGLQVKTNGNYQTVNLAV
jgi:two-component system CheB/CheR fusion protein